MAFRPTLLAAAAVLPSLLAACGGDDGNVIPEGTHYHYVANKVFVPTTNTQAREYGLDLNKDGTVDNQLGMVLSTLGSMGFDIQTTIDTAVKEGSIILLADFQTKDFTNTTAAGVQIFLGDKATAMPAPCSSTTDMVCAHHLDGTGMFTISASSPTNAALGGKIVNGTFNGGPGDLSLQIALGGTQAIQLDLIGARAKGSGITDSQIGTASSGGIVFGGAITKDDIDNKVIPAIQTQLVPIITRDCPTATAPTCVCTAETTGKTILGLFDANDDCMVTVDEIKTNSLIVSLLSPDVTINGKMALSLGIKATAVKATYTVAGQ
ncbi:MAG TPA: hypothetical protein VL326_31665 [Kofleriaceae bacterium]|jgi:hypothetical protein|nr:hypothetical protein [Kofleriaceae bacterium]